LKRPPDTTYHIVRYGPRRGRDADVYQNIRYECQACGPVSTARLWPNLLARFFSVPAKKEPSHEAV